MPDTMQLFIIFISGRRKYAVPLFFQLFDLAFYFCFVNAVSDVVDAVVDAERFAESDEQVFFIKLRISFDRFVLGPLGDFPQLRDGLFLQFLVRICHKKNASCQVDLITAKVEAK
jgi:hypothetical protein